MLHWLAYARTPMSSSVVLRLCVAAGSLMAFSLAYSPRPSAYPESDNDIEFSSPEYLNEHHYLYFGDHGPSPDRWASSGEYVKDANSKSARSMMDTFEKFKRQAVKSVVSGDETIRLGEGGLSPSRIHTFLSWQTATLISLLCVGAVVIGVVLGVLYWPKAAFGEKGDSLDGERKAGAIGSRDSAAERSLAHAAQMYHYQQQKQQMLAMEQAAGKVRSLDSNSDSEAEVEESDVNVYECPGLATANVVEVTNPLFDDKRGAVGGAPSPGASR